jgi:type II secretory pathway pseudopilin PulG
MLAQNQLVGNAYNQAYQNAQTQAQNVANLGLQGAQAGIQGAGQLANIGTGQLAAQQGILGLQNQYGTQQQQQQQNVINQAMQNYATAQQYPMSQLQQLSNLAQPYVSKDVTTTAQAPAPSAVATLGALGTTGIAGLGLYNAMGGGKSS